MVEPDRRSEKDGPLHTILEVDGDWISAELDLLVYPIIPFLLRVRHFKCALQVKQASPSHCSQDLSVTR